ncbi:MAG: hypothetical protein A2V66_13480 [Ignavibacteria bacterium RBG_13_36_8]|nr:MAG: hypothetical protein A2V66_13480 [Ignavibacteria bacterium RBG_13_36_8]
MKEYKYPLLARFIYRYANIPATFLLFIHLIVSISMISEKWYYILPVLINALVIYILNRFYFKVYKYFPFKIFIDNERMVCSDFTLSDKEIKVKLVDIDKITGGIFSGKLTHPYYIHERRHNITLGFFQHIKNFNGLLTIILSNIEKKLYHTLLDDMKKLGESKRRGKK